MSPGWFALFSKCCHALFLIFGGKSCLEDTPLEHEPISQTHFVGLVDTLLSLSN